MISIFTTLKFPFHLKILHFLAENLNKKAVSRRFLLKCPFCLKSLLKIALFLAQILGPRICQPTACKSPQAHTYIPGTEDWPEANLLAR